MTRRTRTSAAATTLRIADPGRPGPRQAGTRVMAADRERAGGAGRSGDADAPGVRRLPGPARQAGRRHDAAVPVAAADAGDGRAARPRTTTCRAVIRAARRWTTRSTRSTPPRSARPDARRTSTPSAASSRSCVTPSTSSPRPATGGAFTFTTGIGGFLQEFLYGYSGMRWNGSAVQLDPSLNGRDRRGRAAQPAAGRAARSRSTSGPAPRRSR